MEEKINNIEAKIDLLQAEVSKMKKYFLATFWITIAFFVLPLLALAFVIPSFLSIYSSLGDFGL